MVCLVNKDNMKRLAENVSVDELANLPPLYDHNVEVGFGESFPLVEDLEHSNDLK